MNRNTINTDQVKHNYPSGYRFRRPILSETIQKHPKISAVIFSIALAVGAIENCNSKNDNTTELETQSTSFTSE